MTRLYKEGYLPIPQRCSRPGSNKPVYVWDESVIERAKFLYDLLQWSHSYQRIRLPLWLRGYPVEFAPLRQQLLQFFDPDLRALAQSEADNPLDNLTDIVSHLEYKWEHTPTRHRPETLQKLGPVAYTEWTELFLGALLVSDYVADETTFTSTPGEDFLSWVQRLHEILTLPRLYEVIKQAVPDAWEQARLDYMTLCQFFQTISVPLGSVDFEGMDLWLFDVGGRFLVPVVLAIRQSGYGYWIDDGFARVNKWLADPATQTRLTKMSELLADAETRMRLTEPEVYMRIIRELSHQKES